MRKLQTTCSAALLLGALLLSCNTVHSITNFHINSVSSVKGSELTKDLENALTQKRVSLRNSKLMEHLRDSTSRALSEDQTFWVLNRFVKQCCETWKTDSITPAQVVAELLNVTEVRVAREIFIAGVEEKSPTTGLLPSLKPKPHQPRKKLAKNPTALDQIAAVADRLVAIGDLTPTKKIAVTDLKQELPDDVQILLTKHAGLHLYDAQLKICKTIFETGSDRCDTTPTEAAWKKALTEPAGHAALTHLLNRVVGKGMSSTDPDFATYCGRFVECGQPEWNAAQTTSVNISAHASSRVATSADDISSTAHLQTADNKVGTMLLGRLRALGAPDDGKSTLNALKVMILAEIRTSQPAFKAPAGFDLTIGRWLDDRTARGLVKALLTAWDADDIGSGTDHSTATRAVTSSFLTYARAETGRYKTKHPALTKDQLPQSNSTEATAGGLADYATGNRGLGPKRLRTAMTALVPNLDEPSFRGFCIQLATDGDLETLLQNLSTSPAEDSVRNVVAALNICEEGLGSRAESALTAESW
ncbi:hypothetical protein FACS189472_07570 [Alphaproteobacteria bacterium]|nr:hypothetical protein FACS189472_07570 [Alphaproteobacteria bacterium]